MRGSIGDGLGSGSFDYGTVMIRTVSTPVVYLLSCMLCLGSVACSGDREPVGSGEPPAGSEHELLAEVELGTGVFTIRLRPDVAPRSVANFVNLVRRGFYHGREVIGSNGSSASFGRPDRLPNYRVANEYSPDLLFDRPGIVAWTFLDTKEATSNQIAHPTRFFVSKAPNQAWNFSFNPFGEVVANQEVVSEARPGDWIRSIRLVGDWEAFLAGHEVAVASWDQALRGSGHLAPNESMGSPPSTTGPGVSSN